MSDNTRHRNRPRPGDPDYKAPDRGPRLPSDKVALLTIPQVELAYGVPQNSLRDLIARKKLPVVRLGGDTRRIWVRRSDLNALIERSVEA